MAKKTVRYKKVPVGIIREIRYLYETGVDLLDLAIKYHIPYGTLKNKSSDEGWEKGSKKDLVYLLEAEEIADQVRIKKEELKPAINLVLAELGDAIGDKESEDALKSRVASLKDTLAITKDIYNIRNEMEEVEHRAKTLKYEQLKKDLEDNDSGDIVIG